MRAINHLALPLCAAGSLGLVLASQANAQEASTDPERMACQRLASLGISNTKISVAELVAPGAFASPAPEFPGFAVDYSSLPAFCRVTGSIMPSTDSDIRFELWLPAQNWNGRFMQTGNGGAAGSIVYGSLVEPLSRGYAVTNTDSGHQGAGGDFFWAAEHPEKLTDFQHRAVHELTLAGKAITAAYYGQTAEKSYWNGCSTGGRQGLKEIQLYPEDYDAVIAGAPANNWARLMSLSVLIQRNLGPGHLGMDKLRLLKEAAIAKCDALDGVSDRVITEPGLCDFEPSQLQCSRAASNQCLSASEVTAARHIYAGLVNESGEVLMPGTGIGSEPAWAAYASSQFSIGTSYFRYVVMNDSDWDPTEFDVNKDVERAAKIDGGAIEAMDPEISSFISRGGKLMLYHGTTDGLIPYQNTVHYYESLVDTLGQAAVADGVRFYPVAGMDHCAGGEGAFAVDWLSALEQWAEHDNAPGALHATHPPNAFGAQAASPGRTFTRPVCPYPQVAKHTRSGDESDAANFECVEP